MIKTGLVSAITFVVTGAAMAGHIPTRLELDQILADSEEYLEDFEEVSVHGGTSLPVANPFNYMTGGPWWVDLIPGATYSSSGDLWIYGGMLGGDDSNILRGAGDITITWDAPQLAIGLDIAGSADPSVEVTIYSGDDVIGAWSGEMSVGFFGWYDNAGITAVTVETNGGLSTTAVDNVAWGIDITGVCVGDIDDSGDIDFGDVLAVLTAWGPCACVEDVNTDGSVDFADLLLLLTHWGECP